MEKSWNSHGNSISNLSGHPDYVFIKNILHNVTQKTTLLQKLFHNSLFRAISAARLHVKFISLRFFVIIDTQVIFSFFHEVTQSNFRWCIVRYVLSVQTTSVGVF